MEGLVKQARRLMLLAGLIALLLLISAACGRHHEKVPGQGAVPPEPKAYTLQDALTELDLLEKPDGVDEKVWAELKGALRVALETKAFGEKNGSGELQFATTSKVSRPGGRESLPTKKLVSTPPTGAANKVNDLTVTRETNGDFTLSWHYRNLGDYDQNGSVGVSDITPLAQHFGETYDAQNESDSIKAVIDGSGNAKIGVEDVTQIAQNFGVAVAKYSVRGSDAFTGPFAETTIVGVSPQVSDARKVLTMNIGASPQGYWQVVPQDAERAQGEASNVAGISLQIRSVTPMEVKEGTVVTFSAEVLGAGPFTYEWDFGGQAVPATSTEASPKVVVTRDTGNFPARLTVTNHMGNTAYPFTLTKLAREWKYEVVLSTDKENERVGNGRLVQYQGTLFYYAYIEDMAAVTTVAQYLVSGSSGNWEFENMDWSAWILAASSEGNLGAVRYTGPFLDWTLNLSEKTRGSWDTEMVEAGLSMTGADFAYATGDVPFITYIYRYWEPETTFELHYARRVEGQWLYGVIDDAGGPGGKIQAPILLRIDMEGNPAVAYRATMDDKTELKLARWLPLTETWATQTVLPSYLIGEFDYSFDRDNTPCFVIDDYYTNPDMEALCYCRLDGGIWERSVVQEWPDEEVSLASLNLEYDPAGNPLVTSYIKDAQCGVWWANGPQWEKTTDLTGTYFRQGVVGGNKFLNFLMTSDGTPYILYATSHNWVDGPKEVVLARYE